MEDVIFWISIAGNLIMVADKIVAKTKNKYDDLILTFIKKVYNIVLQLINKGGI